MKYVAITEYERWPSYDWEEVTPEDNLGHTVWVGHAQPFGGTMVPGERHMTAYALTDEEYADLEDVTERYNDWQDRLFNAEPVNIDLSTEAFMESLNELRERETT